MSLEDEIQKASREIVKDGYEMSIGELISLYNEGDLVINPDFQRYFRWDEYQQTKFIESIMLGIPIPAIFVYQTNEGKWELVDGLQRLSTVFKFAGILRRLKTEDGGEVELYPPSVLIGTKVLPSFRGKKWKAEIDDDPDAFTLSQQRELKRARIRVEILKKESDGSAKFQLFQRLNTGGAELTPQEIRNCTMVMLNKRFAKWLRTLSEYKPFADAISVSESKKEKQEDLEYILRLIVYKSVPYDPSLDVHEYLDESMIQIAEDETFDYDKEEQIFKDTFDLINSAMGNNAFKRFDGEKFLGPFLISSFEVVAAGISHNIERIKEVNANDFVKERITALWSEETFKQYSGAGVRGTTRIEKLLPFAKGFFQP